MKNNIQVLNAFVQTLANKEETLTQDFAVSTTAIPDICKTIPIPNSLAIRGGSKTKEKPEPAVDYVRNIAK